MVSYWQSMLESIDKVMHPEAWVSDIKDASSEVDSAINLTTQNISKLQSMLADTSDEGKENLEKLQTAIETALDFRSTRKEIQAATEDIRTLTGIEIDPDASNFLDTLNLINSYIDGSIDKLWQYASAAMSALGINVDPSNILSAIQQVINLAATATGQIQQMAYALMGVFQSQGLTIYDPFQGKMVANQVKIAGLQSSYNYTANTKGGGGGGSSEADVLEAYKNQKEIYDHQLDMSDKAQDLMEEDTAAYRAEQSKQLQIYQQTASLIKAEMERLKALGYATTSEQMMQLESDFADIQSKIYSIEKSMFESLENAQIKAIEKRKNAEEKRYEALVKQYDYEIDQQQALIDILSSYHDLQKNVLAEQRSLNNELQKAQELNEKYPNTFTLDDYNELSEQLSTINADIASLYDDYYAKIQDVTVKNAYELEFITAEFERQVKLKQAEYDISKNELAVTKARLELQNAQKERSVAQLQGGKWVFGSDPQAVAQAMDALTAAEQEVINARSDYEYDLKAAALESYMDSIEKQKAAAEAAHESVMDKLDRQLESLNEQLFQMTQAIENMGEYNSGVKNAFEALAEAIKDGKSAIAKAASSAAASVKNASSSSSSGSSSSSTTLLKSGSTGSDVANVQAVLNEVTKSNLTVDGIYGSKTTAAVKEFQKSAGLTADGVVGQKTAAALLKKVQGYATGGIPPAGERLVKINEGDREMIFNSTDQKKLFDLVHSSDDVAKLFVGKINAVVDNLMGSSSKNLANLTTNKTMQSINNTYIDGIKLSPEKSAKLSAALTAILPLTPVKAY